MSALGAGVGVGVGVGVGLLGLETDPGHEGVLGDPCEGPEEELDELDVDELPPPLVLLVEVLVEAVLVESPPDGLEVSSVPWENVPRLDGWSRVSSSAWLLKTRPAVGLTSALAVPAPPPPAADRPIVGPGAESDVAPALALAVDGVGAISGAGDAGFASAGPALSAAPVFSELVVAVCVASRAALRRPSAAAAAPRDESAKERAGARTHSKLSVYAKV